VVVMAGPCSVESEAQVLEVADAVKASGARVLRGGAYKPRTSPYAFQGLKEQGLRYLAEARKRTGLPVVTEVLETESVELVAEYADATLVHSSPRDPGEWPYLVSAADGAAAFPAFATTVCFIGHSHLPMVWTLREDGQVAHRRGGGRVTLGAAERHLINVGSVGQPRDGDPLAAYAIWDLEAGTVEIRRVPYDNYEARRRIHDAGLPRFLGDRLLHGR